MLELIFAIILPAASSAILFNIGSSGGGTDIIAMILKKYTSIHIGTALLFVDLFIVAAGCLLSITRDFASRPHSEKSPVSMLKVKQAAATMNRSTKSRAVPIWMLVYFGLCHDHSGSSDS